MNNIKQATEKLKEYFYSTFKNNDYNTTLLNLYNVEERERIINELAENQDEAYFYNNIYEKTLKNIQVIFKNNNEYIKAEQTKQQEALKKVLQKEHEQQEKKLKQINTYKTIVNIFFLFINPITIIIFLLVLGYFKIALPILNS